MNHSKSDINQHKRSRQSSPSPNASHAKHDPQAPIPSQLREGMIHMKNNYQTIPIPENLKSQVESAIRQAKQDLSATPIVPADPTRHKKTCAFPPGLKGFLQAQLQLYWRSPSLPIPAHPLPMPWSKSHSLALL